MRTPNEVSIKRIEFVPTHSAESKNRSASETGAMLRVEYWDDNVLVLRADEATRMEREISLLLEKKPATALD
jgi:hypothetical protein